MTSPSGAALIAVGVALAALLAACGGAPGPTPDPTDREDGPMAAHPTELVITGATVLETPGTPVRRDLHVADGVLAADPPEGEVTAIPAQGMYAVPLLVDSAVAQRPASQRSTYDLVPGNAATFALVRRPVSEPQVRGMLVVDPSDLAAVYVSGHVEALDGAPTRPAGADLADAAARETWVGTWEDPSRGLEQHLGADGRYAETRNGRANAYTGRFWVRDGRITYLDDSGFWAFGELLDGTLHHAGFVMRRR